MSLTEQMIDSRPARDERTIAEAEAFRAGRAEGYDEASRRSGARIAELEAEVARLLEALDDERGRGISLEQET